MFNLEYVKDARISRDNSNIRKVLWHLKHVSPFAEVTTQ